MNEQIDDLIKIKNPNNVYWSPLKITPWQLQQKKRLYHFLIKIFINLKLIAKKMSHHNYYLWSIAEAFIMEIEEILIDFFVYTSILQIYSYHHQEEGKVCHFQAIYWGVKSLERRIL